MALDSARVEALEALRAAIGPRKTEAGDG